MSGGQTHATRVSLHPKVVAFRVLLQSPSARHNRRRLPLKVDRLLEPRTELQSFVLGVYYLARKDNGHVGGGMSEVAGIAGRAELWAPG